MKKKWEFYDIETEKIERLSEELKISPLLTTILTNRNIESKEKIVTFLKPTRNDFYNPYLFQDMEIAVTRIIQAIEKKEKIAIYGDYDVDGITSITVLKKYLEKIGANVIYYIPNRLEEGYGLNKQAIEKIAKEHVSLMITVDCGISGIEDIDYAKKLGVETIVTDHHETLDILPNALAVIDAKRKDNTYPFRELAGVGVVFKVIQAISIKLGLDEKEYLKYLDIVCVGTISDIVPLVDENRVIAKLGLKLIKQTKNIGLRELVKACGYANVNSSTISFGVAPRINACGRMGKQEEALKLFLSEDLEEVKQITQKLNNYNTERQDTERKIFEQALSKIQEENLESKSSIVLGDERWHHGVIGIVASKVTEMFFKPSLLICFEGDMGKGSGRSVPGFDLHEALLNTSSWLEKYGGHSMAVGLSLKRENFEGFKKAFEELADKSNVKEIVPIIKIDKQITAKDMTKENVEAIQLLEPFGEGNKIPIFMYKGLKIDSIRALSENKHIKLTLRDDNIILDAIGFNMGYLVEEYRIGDKIDVVGTLEVNSYNGLEKVQINLKDMRKSY